MREAFGTVMRQKLAIEAESHLVAFGDEDEFVPGGVGFPRNGELLRLQKRVEICGQFLFPIQILLSASTNLQIHHAGLAVTERDAAARKGAVAEMACMDALHLTVHKTELERLIVV